MRINFTDSFEMGTNIDDIEVPWQLRRRQLTGIEWLDKALGGEGFTPSMVTFFTGASGAGKTTALLTMASMLAQQGACVVYNTAEESLFQVKRTVERLKLRGFMVGCENNVDEMLKGAELIRNRPENKSKMFFLIVDSLQCMDDGHFDSGRITSATAHRSLMKIITWAKENYTNPIVIGQTNKSGQFAGSAQLKFAIDCHLSLTFEEKDKEMKGYRKFEVTKNRFGGCGYKCWMSLDSEGFTVVGTQGDE